MFGFLLSIPFANRFIKLDHTERAIYLVTVVLAALSTALLVAPVAYHRLLFRRHEKESLVRVTNRLAIAGLVTVGLAVCSAVLLVTSFVAPGLRAVVITAGLACVFAVLWFALPLSRLAATTRTTGMRRTTGVTTASGTPMAWPTAADLWFALVLTIGI